MVIRAELVSEEARRGNVACRLDDAFGELAERRKFFAGRLMAVQGQRQPELCRVRTGAVLLSRSLSNGDDYAIRLAEDGALFGIEALGTRLRWELTARAVTDGTLDVLPADRIPRMVQAFPELGVQLLQGLGAELESLCRYRDVQQHRSARERLYALLCLLGRAEGVSPAQSVLVPVRFSHADLGQMAGVNRETISRAFSALERQGRIGRQGRRFLWIRPPARSPEAEASSE